ncbi:MAG: hypothetical protein OEZ01_11440 [Candidatus Heimdallarchaeota archaeon]|nr:hypothetical protein [Candidatus Heimdallarchaeota archaeon]MDH5646615.1 hypothetical protein [Candidatus Heimdallarchaeota archaeon]
MINPSIENKGKSAVSSSPSFGVEGGVELGFELGVELVGISITEVLLNLH